MFLPELFPPRIEVEVDNPDGLALVYSFDVAITGVIGQEDEFLVTISECVRKGARARFTAVRRTADPEAMSVELAMLLAKKMWQEKRALERLTL